MSLITVLRKVLRRSDPIERRLQRHSNYLTNRITALETTALDLHSTLHAQLYAMCASTASLHITLTQQRFVREHLVGETTPRRTFRSSQASPQSFIEFCQQECVVLLSQQLIALDVESEFISSDVILDAMDYARERAAVLGLPPLIIMSYQGDTILTFDVTH